MANCAALDLQTSVTYLDIFKVVSMTSWKSMITEYVLQNTYLDGTSRLLEPMLC